MNINITSKEAILNASKEIAAQQGLQAINMRSVAKHCDIAVGSIYNYFSSKRELIDATVEDIWCNIFHESAECSQITSMIECVEWMFRSIQHGANQYPSFFSVHFFGYDTDDEALKGHVFNQYMSHMKQGMLAILNNDERVRNDAFDASMSAQQFIDFVFSNILMLLMNQQKHCRVLTKIIEKAIY